MRDLILRAPLVRAEKFLYAYIRRTWLFVKFIFSRWLLLLLMLNFGWRYHSYAIHRTHNNYIFLSLYFSIFETLPILMNVPHTITDTLLHIHWLHSLSEKTIFDLKIFHWNFYFVTNIPKKPAHWSEHIDELKLCITVWYFKPWIHTDEWPTEKKFLYSNGMVIVRYLGQRIKFSVLLNRYCYSRIYIHRCTFIKLQCNQKYWICTCILPNKEERVSIHIRYVLNFKYRDFFYFPCGLHTSWAARWRLRFKSGKESEITQINFTWVYTALVDDGTRIPNNVTLFWINLQMIKKSRNIFNNFMSLF